MMAVMNSTESPLFELRNFRLNESLFRERNANSKLKPGQRGGSPGRMSPRSRRGMDCESQVKVVASGASACSGQSVVGGGGGGASYSPGTTGIHHNDARSFSPSNANVRPRRTMTFDSHAKPAATCSGRSSSSPTDRKMRSRHDLHESQLLSSSRLSLKPTLTAPAKLQSVETTDSTCRREPLHPSPERRRGFAAAAAVDENLIHHYKNFKDEDVDFTRFRTTAGDEELVQFKKDLLSSANIHAGGGGGGQAELDEMTFRKLAKMVAQEVWRSQRLPIQLDDFTGAKSPYLAEDAMVWLKKLRLAARQNEWTDAQTLEVASIHLRGLAARWFVSIEKHLRETLEHDKDRWEYFQTQFEERFADYRSRLLQIEKIKGMRLREGEDIREYAEAVMSMNCRLDDPLDDEFLGWVFVQGLPPSELRDKLYKFMETPSTLASAVSYARRFQLSQTVFNIKDSIRRTSPTSTPARSGAWNQQI